MYRTQDVYKAHSRQDPSNPIKYQCFCSDLDTCTSNCPKDVVWSTLQISHKAPSLQQAYCPVNWSLLQVLSGPSTFLYISKKDSPPLPTFSTAREAGYLQACRKRQGHGIFSSQSSFGRLHMWSLILFQCHLRSGLGRLTRFLQSHHGELIFSKLELWSFACLRYTWVIHSQILKWCSNATEDQRSKMNPSCTYSKEKSQNLIFNSQRFFSSNHDKANNKMPHKRIAFWALFCISSLFVSFLESQC